MWYRRVVLRPGARGPAVAALRERLLRRGHTEGGAVGVGSATGTIAAGQYFDEALARAVADFQAQHGLTPDGVVGPATWRRLYDLPRTVDRAAGGPSTTAPARTLSPWAPTEDPTESPGAEHAVHVHVSVAERRLALHTWTESNDGTGRWDLSMFPVAVGRAVSPTPPGRYVVRELISHPGSPLGTRWIRLLPDLCGIHGTDEPWTVGCAATPGCIRMYNKDVEFVFHRLPKGTPVIIK